MNDPSEVTSTAVATVTMAHAPDIVLGEAAKAATALKDVLSRKPKKVMMNGEQYMEFEDWQTLGRFYGITAKEDGDPEFVTFGEVQGFKASAVALDAQGKVVSRATSYCLSDEEKWGSRPKYVWSYVLKDGTTSVEDPGPSGIVWVENPNKPGKKMPKKEKVHVGEERVPLFQLSSMAQTRAGAKVLRNVLSWVAVLAGYKPTPAEELTNATEGDNTPLPEKKSEPPQNGKAEPAKPSTATDLVANVTKAFTEAKNEARLKQLYDAAMERGLDQDEIEAVNKAYDVAEARIKKDAAAPPM